mgnify:CR=1 FL=1
MSIIDRLFVGRVVRDFGRQRLRSSVIGKSGRNILLVEKRGELFLAIRSFAVAIFGGYIRYYTFRLANALKLREIIDISEQVAHGLVQRDHVQQSIGLLVGPVVKDYGCIEQERLPIGRARKRAFLVQRKGELQLALTFSHLVLLGWGVAYQHFSLEDARRLRGYLDESERIAANLPPARYNPHTEAIRTAFLVTLTTVGVTFLPIGAHSFIAYWILFLSCVSRIGVFGRLTKTRAYATPLMALLALCVLVVACIKLAPAVGL